MSELLVARDLVKTFSGRGGEVRAVDGVDLDVAGGGSVAIVGESGSGKSTLARLVMRLSEPTSGSLTYAGEDLLAMRGRRLRRQREHMQMVFQNPYGSLLPGLTVEKNIAEPLRIHRIGTPAQRRDKALELMDLVGLPERYAGVYPRQLSGGQQQRVGVARALALGPQLLVCDEPTSALDVSIQAQILTLIEEMRERLGFSMIFITHNLAVAQRMTEQVLVMRSGKVVERGATDEVFTSPKDPYTQELLRSVLSVNRKPVQSKGAVA